MRVSARPCSLQRLCERISQFLASPSHQSILAMPWSSLAVAASFWFLLLSSYHLHVCQTSLLPWLVRLSWITWGNLRISKSLMYSHLPRPLVQSLGMTEKLTFGNCYQAYLTYVQFLHILVASHWIFTRNTSRILAFISFGGVVCFKSLLF